MASANTPIPPSPATTPHPNSRMDQLYTKHRSILSRLDDLESRLASRVAAHRRRATNLIEETPTSRKSHMRIFVSHRVEGGDDVDEEKKDDKADADALPAAAANTAPAPPAAGRPGGKDFSALLHSSAHQNADAAAAETKKPPPHQQQPKKGVRKWTLVIEGGLLIKHLDHQSAKEVDDRLEAGLPILGCKGVDNGKVAQNKADIPLRDQWRGGTSEQENEKDIEPLKFTHFFNKLIKKTDKSEPAEMWLLHAVDLGPFQRLHRQR